MRRLLRFWSRSYIVENAKLLFMALSLFLAGLLVFGFRSHLEIVELAEETRVAHELSNRVLLLSQAHYHTQLELYELFSSPNQARSEDMILHEKAFIQKMKEAYHYFWLNRDHVTEEVKAEMDTVNDMVPVVRSQWGKIRKAIMQGKSNNEVRRMLEEAEELFDEMGFSDRLRKIAEIQIKQVRRDELRTQELDSRHNLIMLLGLLLGLILSSVVAVLHKAALKGKLNQLQLVQASKLASLGELSAGVAHELNNPLMIVKGFNDRIERSLTKLQISKDADVWDYLSEVRAGVDRMKKIIQHFREFSRIESLETESVRVNIVVRGSFILFEEQLRLHNIEVEMNLAKDEPLVQGNANRLEQVLVNLINNSRDALDEVKNLTSKKITVTTKIKADRVLIEFSDNGPGIPKTKLNRVFDPFYTTKPVGKGTGLGLSISQSIIREHHGTIKVDSHEGDGTIFTIDLPLGARPASLACEIAS